MKIWPWSKFRRLEKEIDALVDDATELLYRRLIIENGNIDATIENKMLTKMLAEWGRQIFEQYPEAKNYMSMTFTFPSDDHKQLYELILQKVEGKTPAVIASERADEIVGLNEDIERLRAEIWVLKEGLDD